MWNTAFKKLTWYGLFQQTISFQIFWRLYLNTLLNYVNKFSFELINSVIAKETDVVMKDVVYVFHFGLFFALLPPPPPPNSPKKQNYQNIIKPGDIIILHICTNNYDHVMYSSWDMVRKGQTDRRTEKVAYSGGCPT